MQYKTITKNTIFGVLFFCLFAFTHSAQADNLTSCSLLRESNTQREQRDGTPLRYSQALAAVAQEKAEILAESHAFQHDLPDGRPFWHLLSEADYTFTHAGENLAVHYTTAESTVAGWMNSPSHKAALLNNDFTHVGFGIAYSSWFEHEGAVVVQVFAAPAEEDLSGSSCQ